MKLTKSQLKEIIKDELKNITENSYDPRAKKFLDAIRVVDSNIKDLKDITVDATPNRNWQVYLKRKPLTKVNGRLLDDRTIMKYGLEH
jgi:hypothetical protein